MMKQERYWIIEGGKEDWEILIRKKKSIYEKEAGRGKGEY